MYGIQIPSVLSLYYVLAFLNQTWTEQIRPFTDDTIDQWLPTTARGNTSAPRKNLIQDEKLDYFSK